MAGYRVNWSAVESLYCGITREPADLVRLYSTSLATQQRILIPLPARISSREGPRAAGNNQGEVGG